MIPSQEGGEGGRFDQERYLLARSGYGQDPRANVCIVLCRMEASGVDRNATYDPYSWGNRTMTTAHLHILEHFDEMFSGDVVDVEFIVGITKKPKLSERTQLP